MHIEEMVHQQLHIAVTLTQRRQGNRDNIEAVIEILAEFTFTDKLFQILVGRGHNPDIDRGWSGLSQSAALRVILSHVIISPEQSAAYRRFHPEQRAFICRLNQTLFSVGGRAGKRAFHITE